MRGCWETSLLISGMGKRSALAGCLFPERKWLEGLGPLFARQRKLHFKPETQGNVAYNDPKIERESITLLPDSIFEISPWLTKSL